MPIEIKLSRPVQFVRVRSFWQAAFLLSLSTLGFQPMLMAQGLAVSNGTISIRALADRQRRAEEMEFLNSLNPERAAALAPAPVPGPGSAGATEPAVQQLPPVGTENITMPVVPKEPAHPAVNTLMSVYGPEGKLTIEVAKKAGFVERYQVGDDWAGHRILNISREGATVTRGGKSRLVSVGGRL